MNATRFRQARDFWLAPGIPNQRIQDGFLLLVRLLFGWLLIQTGHGKLIHLERTAEFFATLHLPAPQATALLVGSIEFLGGLLLALGLVTRPAAFLLACTLVGALLSAHRPDLLEGLDSLVATAPFPYLLAVLGLFTFGAGRLSLDRCLFHRPGRT